MVYSITLEMNGYFYNICDFVMDLHGSNQNIKQII